MLDKNAFWSFTFIHGVIYIYSMLSIGEAAASNNSVSEYIREVNPEIADGLRIKVYTGHSASTANVIDVPITKPEEIFKLVDPAKPLVYYTHGYIEHPSNESVQTIVDAHLKRGTDNIFLLDWSDFSSAGGIFAVLGRIKDIAKITARSFDAVVDLGLDVEKFQFIGHSMGAHVAGFFGKYSKNSIPRITGLDPAFPGFYVVGIGHLDKDSARFVDVIHTDAGVYGTIFSTGHVDFWANGGSRPQPGCPLLGFYLTPRDLCSHWRSWRFYSESVNNNAAFLATQCSNYILYKTGLCKSNNRVQVGYATPRNISGSYYFQTGDKFSYSKIN